MNDPCPAGIPDGIRPESAGSPGYTGPGGVPATETETETEVTPLGPPLTEEPDTRKRAPRITRHDLDRLEDRLRRLDRKVDQVLELLGRSATPSQAQVVDGTPAWLPGTGRLGGNRKPGDLSADARAAHDDLAVTVTAGEVSELAQAAARAGRTIPEEVRARLKAAGIPENPT